MDEANPDIPTLPFEAALAELEQIVDQLEKGAVALDESSTALKLKPDWELAAPRHFVGVFFFGLGDFDRDVAFGFAHQARADHARGELVAVLARER